MIGLFSKKNEDTDEVVSKPKFRQGDMGFTRKDCEKVFILKCLSSDPEDRNADLGPSYLVRGNDQFTFKLYECEIMTLDEFIGKGGKHD